ncbi:MAG TPA: PqqD family protein [Ktedonobacterales bacterium]
MTDSPSPLAGPKSRQGVETYIVPDGTCFIYDPLHDTSYALDQLGALVWDYCDGRTPVDRMIAEVSDLIPGAESLAARVTGLLAEFAQEDLLEAPPTKPRTSESEGGAAR